MDDLLRAYRRDLCRIEIVSHEQTLELYQAMDDGDEDARGSLVKNVLPLAWHIAAKWHRRRRYLDMADLVQAANLGAIRGVDHWDPDRGRLTTVAAVWITQAVQSFVENDNLIRVPNHAVNKRRKVVTHLGRAPESDQEIADACDELEITAVAVVVAADGFLSGRNSILRASQKEDDVDSMIDLLEAPTSTVQEHEHAAKLQLAHALIDQLPGHRERCIIRRRYLQHETLAEIAADYNVSKQWIHFQESRALTKMFELSKEQSNGLSDVDAVCVDSRLVCEAARQPAQ